MFGLLVVFCIGLAIVEPTFIRSGNLRNILVTTSILVIPSIGMTLLITSGAFDLSVGSILGLTSAVTASLVPGSGVTVAVTAGLLVAAAVGVTNGLVVTKLGINPLIATLAMLTILRGAALVYTDGKDQLSSDPAFKVFSSGELLGVPVPVVLMLVVLAIAYYLLHQTRFGRHVIAIGSNDEAATNTGLHVDRIRITLFTIVAVTAGLWGIIVASQLQKGSAVLGVGNELDVIAVVVIGGTALTGGTARLGGTLLGAALLVVMRNGLNLLNVSSFYQQIAVGVLLITAVALQGLFERRGQKEATSGP
jgi:ribose/xylose/arabinose/galactoside ABC-type transport system permease subunit